MKTRQEFDKVVILHWSTDQERRCKECHVCTGPCVKKKRGNAFLRGSAICRTCEAAKDSKKDLIACSACKTEFPACQYSTAMLLNFKKTKGERGIVCDVCLEKGCTSKDINCYACSGCGKSYGMKEFDANLLKNAKQRNILHRLHCHTCSTRLRALEISLKTSRVICNCGSRSSHAERCPVFLKSVGQDVLTVEDRQFLTSVQPKFWTKLNPGLHD